MGAQMGAGEHFDAHHSLARPSTETPHPPQAPVPEELDCLTSNPSNGGQGFESHHPPFPFGTPGVMLIEMWESWAEAGGSLLFGLACLRPNEWPLFFYTWLRGSPPISRDVLFGCPSFFRDSPPLFWGAVVGRVVQR